MIDMAIFEGDPPIRADGLCAVCLKPRLPGRSRRYAGVIAELDPFCSTGCARVWHGNPLPEQSIWSKPGYSKRFAA